MQTIIVVTGTKAQSVADSIVELLQTQTILAVQAIGSDAISETISGIAKAKQVVAKTQTQLNIKPVFPEQVTQDNPTTIITFQITTENLFIDIDSL